jgi:flagellar motor protein MotB
VQAKNRLPRIERPTPLKVHEDENQHLWAVSYADFLMALLSFFILFFSIDTPKRQELILSIASQIDPEGHSARAAAANGTATKEAQTHSKDKAGRAIASECPPQAGAGTSSGGTCMLPTLIDVLSTANYEVAREEDHLLIHFQNDLFSPGEFELSMNAQNLILEFLKKMEPYKNAVNFFFVGHADQSPVLHPKNRIVNDNFVLSSLRASSALAFARQHGFEEKNLYTQAASSNLRNSRSLSVRIEMKEKSE